MTQDTNLTLEEARIRTIAEELLMPYIDDFHIVCEAASIELLGLNLELSKEKQARIAAEKCVDELRQAAKAIGQDGHKTAAEADYYRQIVELKAENERLNFQLTDRSQIIQKVSLALGCDPDDESMLSAISKQSPAIRHEGLPKGWRLEESSNCYRLVCDGLVVANLAGPKAEANATILARALSPQPAIAGKAVDCYGYYRQLPQENDGKEYFFYAMFHGDTNPDFGERMVKGVFIPEASPLSLLSRPVTRWCRLSRLMRCLRLCL